MNRSQRRLQQLKQTVSMKLAILEKQKEDIKEILDDYSAQVVAKVEHLLGNEFDLLQNPELCHEIIQNLDKASQVFTDVAINLDVLLDAADCKAESTAREHELHVSSKYDKEDNKKISELSKSSQPETERSIQQINSTISSQQFGEGQEKQQHETITNQQVQLAKTDKHMDKPNEENHVQNQEQRKQFKDHATLSGCLSVDDLAAQDQFVVHEPIYQNSRTAPQQTLESSLRWRDPVSPLSRHTAHSSDLPIVSTVSQDQQQQLTQMPCHPALTSVIVETTTSVSECSETSTGISGTASALCNVGRGTSIKHASQSVTKVEPVVESDKENIRSQQPHLEPAHDTVGVSFVSGQSSTAVETKKTLRGSPVTKNNQECTQNEKNSPSSHHQRVAMDPQVPRSLHRSVHMHKNVNVKRSSASRNLTDLMKKAEKEAHEKSTKLNRDVLREKTSKAPVLKTEPMIALAEASVSSSQPKEPDLKVPYNKLQTTLSSCNGNIQENRLEKQGSDVASLTISSLQLEKDSLFSATVSSSVHPWSFHVQLVGLIQVISSLITHTVKTGETTSIIPHVGLFCLAKSSDQNYYRARVLSIEESQDGLTKNVKIVLIDYGIRKVVSLADIYSIPDSLRQYPCQALFCALHKVGPKNSNCLWTEEAILEFQQCIKDKQVQVRVVYPSPSETDPLFPNIVDVLCTMPQTTQKGVSVTKSMAEYLIEGDFAKDMQVEEYIAALGQMFTPDKHNTNCRMKGLQVCLSDKKAQSVTTTKLEVYQKPKVGQQPLRFKKAKPKGRNPLSEPSATSGSSSPTSSYCGSVSDTAEVSRISRQTEDKYGLSILVNEKLLSWHPCVTSSYTDSNKLTERLVGGKDSGLSNNCDDSQPECSQDDAEVKILVMISQVISPSSFFVHLVDKDFIQKLQTLEEELMKLSTLLTKQPAWFNPARNSLVCVTDSTESSCYRGLVLDIKSEHDQQGDLTDDESSGRRFLIFFIDYGDFEWIPRSRLFPLPNNLQNHTASVVWCSLKGVQPLETPTSSSWKDSAVPHVWPRDVVNTFKSMVLEKKVFSAILLKEALQQINNSTNFQCEPVPVFLLDRDVNGEEVCINYELICHNLASLRPSASDLDQSGISAQWDPMTEEYTSIRNSYKVDTDEAGVALVGYTSGAVPKGGQKVCVYFNRPKGCLRGEHCPNRHIKVDLSDVPYERVPVKIFDEDQSDLLPQPGSLVTVTVSVVFTPSLFYVTLPWGQLTVQQIRDPQLRNYHCQQETLESMMANMQQFYSKYPGYDGDLTLLAPGEAMAAKVRGQWVRAKVICTDVEENLVQVVLVDYGHVDWVSQRDLHELGLQFLHLTPQAVECSLVDVEPPDESGSWNEETCKQFAQMVEGKTLLARVKHRYPSGKISVALFETDESTNPSINQQLEDLGLAGHSVASGAASETRQATDDGGRKLNFMPG